MPPPAPRPHLSERGIRRIAGATIRGRRIDYVFVRCEDSLYGPSLDVRARTLAFDGPVGSVWASDHFGVVAGLSVPDVCS